MQNDGENTTRTSSTTYAVIGEQEVDMHAGKDNRHHKQGRNNVDLGLDQGKQKRTRIEGRMRGARLFTQQLLSAKELVAVPADKNVRAGIYGGVY